MMVHDTYTHTRERGVGGRRGTPRERESRGARAGGGGGARKESGSESERKLT
jgi:hypothetical protein